MTTSAQYLKRLTADIGYAETPHGSNCNRYSHQLGRPCEPWCADFLAAQAHTVGLALPSYSASTITMYHAFAQAGRAGHVPKVGAFAFFNFPQESAQIDHVGCVESWGATSLTTIDGNTSINGSQYNGGSVQRRTRSRSLVFAYGYPIYSDVPAPPPFTGITEHPIVEVDVAYRPIDVTISTDDQGNGWFKVPYQVDQIIGHLGPGLRPAADGKYLAAEVGFAPEDQGTIVSVTDWAPHVSCVVRIRVTA